MLARRSDSDQPPGLVRHLANAVDAAPNSAFGAVGYLHYRQYGRKQNATLEAATEPAFRGTPMSSSKLLGQPVCAVVEPIKAIVHGVSEPQFVELNGGPGAVGSMGQFGKD
jgi:hypothetical protein